MMTKATPIRGTYQFQHGNGCRCRNGADAIQIPKIPLPLQPRGTGTPGVVSIMRIVDRSGFVESGDFDVRIILTEEPMDGLTTDKIVVENGSVKSGGIVKGLTYKGGH